MRDMGPKGSNVLMQEMRDQLKSGYQYECWEGDSIEDPSDDHERKDGAREYGGLLLQRDHIWS